MDLANARKLVDATPTDYQLRNRIFLGMQIIARHDDDIAVGGSHDCIYVSTFDSTTKKMSEEEVEELATLGWFESEESWAHFI